MLVRVHRLVGPFPALPPELRLTGRCSLLEGETTQLGQYLQMLKKKKSKGSF